MNSSEKLQGVSVSIDNLRDQIKNYLYSLGYAKGQNEYISHVEFGALHEDDLIPVHFWIKSEEEEGEEVIEYSKNGKSTKKL